MKQDVSGAKHFHEALAATPKDLRQQMEWSFHIADEIEDVLKSKGMTQKELAQTPWHLNRCRITLAWRRSQLHAIHPSKDFCRVGCAADFGAELEICICETAHFTN